MTFFTSINGIGIKTAETVIRYFTDKDFIDNAENLFKAGLNSSYKITDERINNSMEKQVWCITGSFVNYKPRSLAGKEIEIRGGRTVSSITGKTTHLLAGESAGSKLKKSRTDRY